MNILIFLDHFSPAFKAGGPIRIFESLTARCHNFTSLRIVTQNVDWHDSTPLPVEPGVWIPFGNASVLYQMRGRQGLSDILRTVRETSPDVIHLHSLFSQIWTLKVLLLQRLGLLKVKILLCPHGELAPPALNIKPARKNLFLMVGKRLGLFRRIIWVATSPKEVGDIREAFGSDADVRLAPPPFPASGTHAQTVKRPGALRMVFLARLGPMKNLEFLHRLLSRIKGKVTFDIFGPVDAEYAAVWKETLSRLRALGPDISVNYKGVVSPTQTSVLLAQYDLFVQPSLAESFGYSIVEALAVGTPVLISDQTPWNCVNDEDMGAALALDDPAAWVSALQDFIDMPEAEWMSRSHKAIAWVNGQKRTGDALLDLYDSMNLRRNAYIAN